MKFTPTFSPFPATAALRFVGAVAIAFASARTALALTATPSTTEGPYYTLSSANNADKTHFTGEGIDNDLTHITSTSTLCNGTIMLLSGQLLNTSGTAISGATIELWEADNGGIYWYTSSSSSTNAYANRDKNFQGYGTSTTDSSGNWSFRTIKPGLYVGRIRHFHFKVRIGSTVYLTSQFMFSEDSASFSSDGVASPLVSAGTMSLVTITPTSGTDSSGTSVQLASKDIVINYSVTATAPSITTQPTSVSVATGASASFTVAASGTATLTYQWYKDASAISGATAATYTIGSVTTASAGSYYAVVTNTSGTATSSSATLTVTSSVTAPTITSQPSPAAIATGEAVTLAVIATGDGALSYQWYHDDIAVSGATASTYVLSTAAVSDRGTYAVVVTNPGGSTTSDSVGLLVTTATSSGHRLSNLSARGYLPGSATPLVAGFVVQGIDGKTLLLRAIGPTLTTYDVQGALADPLLTVYDSSDSFSGSNDSWSSSLSSTFTQVGAFALDTGSQDAALVVDLPAGRGTAHVTGTAAGVALVEAYDLDTSTTAKLINLSARCFIGTGDSVLVAGFVIDGTGGMRVLIRGIGPELQNYGVSDYLADPRIEIYNASGTLVATNDNWSNSLTSTFSTLGAFALTSGSNDAALVATLPAGNAYTAVVRSADTTTGQALVELYEVP